MKFENIDNIHLSDHAMRRFGQFLEMSKLPKGMFEDIDGNKSLIINEVEASLENPHWERIVEYRQHDVETGEYEKTLYVIDLRDIFYDEERDDYWAYFMAVVVQKTDGWVIETVMPNGFVTRSEVTGKFRRAA